MRKYAFKCPKGKVLMTLLSKRLVGIAASTVLLSLVSAAAHALDTDVLTLGSQSSDFGTNRVTTTYTFTSPMILKEIGFVTTNNTSGYFEYWIKGVKYKPFEFNDSRLSGVDNNGIRWLLLPTPVALIANETVVVDTVRTLRYIDDPAGEVEETAVRFYNSVIPNVNVVTNGIYGSGSDLLTNSNLRVSNPSSNVAPEPGSFALALTGGAALLGICIRRRRNAA
jgi:hypothetical protein